MPYQDIPKHMKILPAIAQLALVTKTASPAWLWFVMRSHVAGNNHDGKFGRRDLYTIVTQSTMITKKTLSRWLAAGDGIYWHQDSDRVYMRSSGRVAVALATIAPADAHMNYEHTDAVYLPVAKFAGHQERIAWLYWSLFAGRKTVTMARATIQQITGLSPHQQRGYEAILSDYLKITTNYAYADHDRHHSEDIFNHRSPGHAYTIPTKRRDYHGATYDEMATFWQLPNTYHVAPTHKASNRRITRKIAGKIASTRQSIAECTYRRIYAVREAHLRSDDTIATGYVLAYFNGSKRLWIPGELY